jgi:hypothetical protein
MSWFGLSHTRQAIDTFTAGATLHDTQMRDFTFRVSQLENQVDFLVGVVSAELNHFGRYNQRTQQDLFLMMKQIDMSAYQLMHFEAHVRHDGDNQQISSIRQLLSRLRNNRARIDRCLEVPI